MLIRNEMHGLVYYTSQLLSKAGFRHMFCSRMGGVSYGDFASLNVSTARKDANGYTDSPTRVEENYRRALAVLGVAPENACAAKQVHSGVVVPVTETDGGRGICASCAAMPEGDGLLLKPDNGRVSAVCVKTADCVPILLANRRTGAVCAVHAGWRGSAAGIVAAAAERLAEGKPEDVLATVGPCIGVCCYEVGNEVVGAFSRLLSTRGEGGEIDRYLPLFPSCSMGGKHHVDLAGINRLLLVHSGVPEENIEMSGMCTGCFRDEATGEKMFFSHRASGGHSGTFPSFICTK